MAVAPLGLTVPGAGRRVSFGAPGADVAKVDGSITWEGAPLLATSELRLRGAHNLENAMGAAAAALASGAGAEAVSEAFRSFAGVAHRLEEVGTVNGVLFVNDSKATNVAAARRGIEAFPDGVHVILGGSLKGGGFRGLRDAVATRCRAAYLIGQAAEELERDLAGTVPLRRCGDLETAVGPRRRRPCRARWCCSHRPARATTSSATTRSAESGSDVCCRRHDSAPRRRREPGCLRVPPASDRSSTRSSTRPRCACSPSAR